MNEPKIYYCGGAAVAEYPRQPRACDYLKYVAKKFLKYAATAVIKRYAGEKAANHFFDMLTNQRH